MTAGNKRQVEVQLGEKGVLRVEPVAARIFRVRLSPDGLFPEPGLVRYGVVRSAWPAISFDVDEGEERVEISTGKASLEIDRHDGRLRLKNAEKGVLLREVERPACDPTVGFRAAFELQGEERLYGLGDQTRDRIEKRGHLARIWVQNVASYVPIPLVLSSGGWGLFVNSSWRHYVDLGHTDPERFSFGGKRGSLDYFLFVGADLPELLDRYTDIAGKPSLLPLWGYGLTFVCNQQASAREMLDDCLNLRREQIPCDLVGLEPGWMSEHYDYTVDKKWHPERFYIPSWGQKGPHTFLAAAERLGFKMSLWLCCDYDLSLEEERRAGAEQKVEEEVKGFHPDDFEQDQHFGHGPIRMDKLTRPEEPWFEHLKKFVDQGVSAFKMDGALQVNEHPDRKWGNGMDDEEMHNLYPVLLNKQMSRGFREHTGRRAMIYSSGGYAGIQQHSATWAGDTGGGPRPLVSILNHGLSGHVNASCDMEVFSAEGIHFGFLQPWSQVCSWAYWRHPWLLGDELGEIFKFYARLRYRLLPYIYSTAHVAARTGLPIMRAMALAFPEEERGDELIHQYMFGASFLTGAFVEKMHLPKGAWIDYWTGKRYEGSLNLDCEFPEGRGGPLFVRAGAIIPEWPEMQYVGQKQLDELGLELFPHGESGFTLYEDDGVSHAYMEGAVATTQITCSQRDGEVTLEIGPRKGAYEGMPEQRSFTVRLRAESAPTGVELNGTPVDDWQFEGGAVRLRIAEDPQRAQSATAVFRW